MAQQPANLARPMIVVRVQPPRPRRPATDAAAAVLPLQQALVIREGQAQLAAAWRALTAPTLLDRWRGLRSVPVRRYARVVSPFAVTGAWVEAVRLLVTAVLSVGIVGAAVYEQIVAPNVDSPLIGWAGTVVGVFVGHQVATQSARSAAAVTLAAAAQPVEQPPPAGAPSGTG